MTLTTIKPAGLSKPVDLADGEKIRFGTGNDLQIEHTGGANSIQAAANQYLYIYADELRLNSKTGAEKFISMSVNGATELYYDNSKKFATLSTGAKVFGDLHLPDSDQIKLGNGDDFIIGHNGTNSTIQNFTGNLRIRNAGEFQVTKSSTENMLIAKPDGAVELYHNNVKMLETVDVGVKVGDSKRYVVGDDADGYLRYNSNTVELYVAHAQPFKVSLGGETALLASANGAVELYYNNVKKFETYAHGAKTNGVHSIVTGDNSYLALENTAGHGTAYVRNYQGDLLIESPDDVTIESGSSSEVMAKFIGDGAVELYHNNTKKLTTTSTGIDINTGGSDGGSSIKIYGHDTIKRNNWGYSTAYKGIQIGRSDSNVNSSIFIGVDPSSNTSGAFGGYGQEIIFRNDLAFYHPNNANDNWKSFMRTGRFADTGAVCFPNGLGFGSDTATDNVMDDYEEGTFTPTNGTVGLNSANGRYTKIGNVVTFHLRAVFANNSSAVAAYIDGLPYNSAANWGGSYPHSCTIGYATGNHIQFALLSGSSDRIYLYDKNGNSVQLTHFDNDDIRIGGSYIV